MQLRTVIFAADINNIVCKYDVCMSFV